MLDLSKLRPDTRSVWQCIECEPLLAGFVLIGGTALTLRIGHRVSEDLDFAFLGDRLPSSRLRVLRDQMGKKGFQFDLIQDLAAEQEFEDSGLALAEHQQNYLVNGTVKVSFVRLDNTSTNVLSGFRDSPVRVATLDEIFKTKSLVCAERSKSRDWLDLYVLMRNHGYGMEDLYRAFRDAGHPHGFSIAELRLRACKPSALDEGYQGLTTPTPSLDEVRAYFNAELDRLQVKLAREAYLANQRETGKGPG